MSSSPKRRSPRKSRSPSKSRSRSPSPKSKDQSKPVVKLGAKEEKSIRGKGGKYIKSVEPVRQGLDVKIVFQGEEMDPTFINGLRRILMAEIPTYSLSKNLTPLSNTSVPFKNNEFVIERFSMMPIFIKEGRVIDDDLFFYICAEGDPDHPLVNENDQDLTINGHDLQIFDSNKNRSDLSIKELIIYNQPLLKLRKGEEFHFRGQIARGIGHYHTTFKSCRVAYKYENEVSMKEPTTKTKLSPITGKPLETLADKRNYGRNRWSNPEHISLTLKPLGHYDPSKCFELALDTLEQKLLILQNLLGNPRHFTTTKIEIIPDTNIEDRILVKIQDIAKTEEFIASHTIAEMLARHMYYKLFDKVKGNMDKLRESLVSCRRMHRLDPVVMLDIKTPPNLYPGSDEPGLQLLNETIDDLLSYTLQLKKDFKV